MSEKCIRICNAIGELTSGEGSILTLVGANPDFNGPEQIIECSGDWNNFEDERFEGDSLVDCLELAVSEKRKALTPSTLDMELHKAGMLDKS